jgi:hypothetical protein
VTSNSERPDNKSRFICFWLERIVACQTALFNQPRTRVRLSEHYPNKLHYLKRRALPEKAPRPSSHQLPESQFVFALPVFLLGIGQEPPPQQQDSLLSMPLQQAWAFLPFFFFLQQDMSALQQSFMSQQLAELSLFCGGFRVRAPAETARAVAQAKVIKSTLTFLIIVAPKSKNCWCNSGRVP